MSPSRLSTFQPFSRHRRSTRSRSREASPPFPGRTKPTRSARLLAIPPIISPRNRIDALLSGSRRAGLGDAPTGLAWEEPAGKHHPEADIAAEALRLVRLGLLLGPLPLDRDPSLGR